MAVVNFGFPLRHLRSCPSTNTIARELAEAGAPGGTVVTADQQTAGRGRQRREWLTAPPGTALAYSAVHRDREISPLLSLTVAVAVCEAIGRLAPLEPKVKWPNDIWLDKRKCAGILIEGRPAQNWAVIGVGINLALEPTDFPPELRERATSVGHGVGLKAARDALNERLGTWMERDDREILEAFEQVDALRGRTVNWESGSGIAGGTDRTGRLLVTNPDGETSALSAGEVHLDPIAEAAD